MIVNGEVQLSSQLKGSSYILSEMILCCSYNTAAVTCCLPTSSVITLFTKLLYRIHLTELISYRNHREIPPNLTVTYLLHNAAALPVYRYTLPDCCM